MRKIVLPGELVSTERKRVGDHAFLQDGKIFSDCVGLLDDGPTTVAVVPLQGRYVPKTGDVVVGIVSGEKATGYMIDINSFSQCYLSKKDVRETMKMGTIVSAKIDRVNELNEADLFNARAFYGGELLCIAPVKVPRLIGKNGSMLDTIKYGTNTNLVVGRNGWIWAKGGDTDLASKAVDKIEREAHVEHLTEKITDFLKQHNPQAVFPAGNILSAKPTDMEHNQERGNGL